MRIDPDFPQVRINGLSWPLHSSRLPVVVFDLRRDDHVVVCWCGELTHLSGASKDYGAIEAVLRMHLLGPHPKHEPPPLPPEYV